jgi:hypothetical protein
LALDHLAKGTLSQNIQNKIAISVVHCQHAAGPIIYYNNTHLWPASSDPRMSLT